MSDQVDGIWRILMPGLVFQSVVVGGGYATGRELVQFFLIHGAIGALCGLALTALLWSLVLGIAFRFARKVKAYDYDSFFRELLGPFRFLFELIYVLLVILVIGVMSSAADEILQSRFNAPPYLGVVLLITLAGLISALDGVRLARLMSIWGILLYAAYLFLFALIFFQQGDTILSTLSAGEIKPGWVRGSIEYAGYNLAALPAILFALSVFRTDNEATISGILAGWLAILPAVIFAFTLFAVLPSALAAPVPLTIVLNELQIGFVGYVLDTVIFGTLALTLIGGLNAINNRIDVSFRTRRSMGLSPLHRMLSSLTIIALSLGLGMGFGIINLIATGYGVLTYAYLSILVIPMLTFGLWKAFRA